MTIAPKAKSEWKDAHVHPPGFRARRGLNWFTVGLLYSMYYMCRYNFRFAGPGMRAEFLWDPQQIADLAGWFSLAYGTGQLVNGLFSDRIGGRATMLIGAIGSIIVNLVIGFSPWTSSFLAFATLWMINGYIQACGAPGMVKTNAAWFNREERGVFSGIFGFMIQSGQTMISLLVPVILNGFTFLAFVVGPGQWRMLFTLPPIGVALVAIAFYFISSPSPDEAGYEKAIHDDVDNSAGTTVPILESFKFIFLNPLVWFYAVAYACTGAVRHASDQLAPLYFEDVLGFNMKTNLPEIAVGTLALIPMVAVAGSVLSGWVSDRFFRGHRYPVAMFLYYMESVVIAVATVVMANKFIGPSAGGILLGCLFLVLIAITANSTHSIVGAAAPMDIGGKKMAGFAAGVIDSFQYYGAAIGLFVTGRLLRVSDGNYTYMFGIMTCFAFFGGCAMLALLFRQQGRRAASRAVIAGMALLVVAAVGLGVPKYRAQKAAHEIKVAAEAAAQAEAEATAAAEAEAKAAAEAALPKRIAPAMDDDTFEKKAKPKAHKKSKKSKKPAAQAPAP
ncbi:MAG TPA: MFS transporter [Kiritimatiellia bacterium]|nr:MFS transporter [Kiritimatiellia bacterium]